MKKYFRGIGPVGLVTLIGFAPSFGKSAGVQPARPADYEEAYLDSLPIDWETEYEEFADSVAYDAQRLEYVGTIFKAKGNNGADYVLRVNEDGETVTMIYGKANGIEILSLPPVFNLEGLEFALSEIGMGAFSAEVTEPRLHGVKVIDIPATVIKTNASCFMGAPDLETVYLPASVTNIAPTMFKNCKALRKVEISYESNLEKIESLAFDNCSNLQSFTIPPYIQEFGAAPWRGCTSLGALSEEADAFYSFPLEDGVVYDNWFGKLIQYPVGKMERTFHVPFGMEEIGKWSFSGNPYIEEVYLPASITKIDTGAFSGCTSLKQVWCNGKVAEIGKNAFKNCPSLEKITLYGNPQYYASESGESDRSFDATTQVVVSSELPEVKLVVKDNNPLKTVFDIVAAFPYFQTEQIEDNSDYGLPKEMGEGRFTMYGNSGPREEVSRVVNSLPEKMLVYEIIDEKTRLKRLYVDTSDSKNIKALVFIAGIGGNDLVLAYFENGDVKGINNWVKGLKNQN